MADDKEKTATDVARERGFSTRDEEQQGTSGRMSRSQAGKTALGLLGGGLEAGFIGKRQQRKNEEARRNEVYNAFWSNMSPEERVDTYFDDNFNVDPDKVAAEVERYRQLYKEMGYSDAQADAAAKQFEDRINEEARGYRNSERGQTDFAQQRLDQAARDYYEGRPTEESLSEVFDQYYDFNDPRAYLQGDSQLAGAMADQDFIDAQKMALGQLQEVASQGGRDRASQMQADAARIGANQNSQQQQAAIREQMAARGIGGGGLEMAALMGANQAGNTQYAMQEAQLAADARTRALQAMQDAANIGHQGRTASFEEAKTRGAAADDWQRSNADYYRQDRDTVARGKYGSQIDAFNAAGQGYNAIEAANMAKLGTSGTREAREFAASQAAKDRTANAISSSVGAVAGAAGSMA